MTTRWLNLTPRPVPGSAIEPLRATLRRHDVRRRAGALALLREVAGLYAEARDRPGTPARDLLAYVKTLNDLLSDLGFDPSARARLGLAEVKTLSAAEKIIQKRAARSS